ncbi:MAG: putative 2-phosphoglycerate kinase [Streblomastix strix]|uniref:Putative 2-phosphoglycerate kinase n=1 Tax=Streblomastix strix TaxID=222440 RepID=A0A5J4WSE4_9EUKA|nr:MAG: putative 2-phosphoglycerate kinase [Streblomastix strix]
MAQQQQQFGPGSKYDYVKVRIRVGGEHHVVFSRFVISRFLRAVKISEKNSQKIALELKKLLVDRGLFDITQGQLDMLLFFLIQKYGYTLEHFTRYRMISTFFRERIPLIIIIAGTGCLGKRYIATKLANQLNLPNVLHTSLVTQIQASTKLIDEQMAGEHLWHYQFEDEEAFITEYRKQTKLVRKGIDFDIKKSMKEERFRKPTEERIRHIK